jgi:hypothetical protein
VSTFANSDTYGSNGISQFQLSAVGLGIKILSASLFPVGTTNFASAIEEALSKKSRIFVFFMAAKDMGTLLLQGYDAGLFTEGTQIIASDAGTVAAVWAGMLSLNEPDIPKIMKGIIGYQPSPDYTTPAGVKFLNSFLKESNTVPVNGVCDNTVDDDGVFLFKQDLSKLTPPVYTCYGVNFTIFLPDGSNMDDYCPYTYDATYAMALAMHDVLYKQHQPSIVGKNLFLALVANVSFIGVTGLVSFSGPLTNDLNRFAEGDRRTGVSYKILNFQPDVYASSASHSLGFVNIGRWSPELGNIISEDSVIYNTPDNSIPSDLPAIIMLQFEPGYKKVGLGLGIVLFIVTAVFAFVHFWYRKTKLVKSLQLKMQCLIVLGGFFGAVRVITGHLDITDTTCSLNVWFGHLSFFFIFGPMLLKTWRIHRILNNKTLKRISITENYIIALFVCLILFLIVYLAILQGLPIFRPVAITKNHSSDGSQFYEDTKCGTKVFGKLIILLDHIFSFFSFNS